MNEYRGNYDNYIYCASFITIIFIISMIIFLIVKNNEGIPDKHKDIRSENVLKELSPEEYAKQERMALIEQADKIALGYDYDQATTVINSYKDSDTYTELTEAKNRYSASKSVLVEQDIMQIPHIFFHSLIADTAKAFDNDMESDGYNQYMTTVAEFNKIIQQMYDRGYVLISIHDMAYKVQNPDGSFNLQKGSIMLPPGKKAFVLSVDDVNYYKYMQDDGFASRIVLDENGKPVNEMNLDDGTTSRGAYDVVPLLDQFIEKHPDFSYKGARGILAITGYEGVMGYRTCPTDDKNGYNESDIEKAKVVAEGLKADGWEFASHTWGHHHMGQIDLDGFQKDTDRWKAEVEPILGPTDIYIYPYGEDIAGIKAYGEDNPKFQYLKQAGFDYFCNVDSHNAWIQMGSNYLRQGRRNLDGYRMYYDMIDDNIDRLSDLFSVSEVFDAVRPTPVKPINDTEK